MGNWSKSFIKIYPFNLSVSLSNNMSLDSDHCTMFILFIFEYPLGANDIVISRSGNKNKGPYIVFGKLM